MTERRLPCDELVYNTLLDGCVRSSDLNTGIGLFGEMLNAPHMDNPRSKRLQRLLQQQVPRTMSTSYENSNFCYTSDLVFSLTPPGPHTPCSPPTHPTPHTPSTTSTPPHTPPPPPPPPPHPILSVSHAHKKLTFGVHFLLH